MKIKIVLIIVVFLSCLKTQAQSFFTEDFNSYPIGHLNAVYDGATPGQGWWLVSRHYNNLATGMITAEAGKGNVLTITTTDPTLASSLTFKQEDGFLATMWNNRTPGNNILKFEYEYYCVGNFSFAANLISDVGLALINTAFQSNLKRILGSYTDNTSSKTLILKNYNTTPFPYNMWIKAEMFVDYNANNVYFYIPTLNIQATEPFSHNDIPSYLHFHVTGFSAPCVVKIDNIKVSGLKTLPPYILSVNQQLATKFNLYPNPATNVVDISNAENMQVNQITVYTLAGKQVSTQTYNNQAEIQLNVEHLASGTYLLYLQTAQGTVVKKLVKK